MRNILDLLLRIFLLSHIIILNISFLLRLIITNFLLCCLLSPQVNGMGNELGVFLHKILDPRLFQVLQLIVLEEEGDFGSPSEFFVMVVVLSGDDKLVSNQESGVEANTFLQCLLHQI